MKTGYLGLIIILHFCSCCFGQSNEGIVHRYFNNFEDSTLNAVWMNPNTITSGNDTVKNHFTRTDKINPYSSGIEITIPENLKRKNFEIKVTGLIRVSDAAAKTQLVISISHADSAIFWKGVYLPDSPEKSNEWVEFNTSALIPMSLPIGSKLKIFLWNATGQSMADVDDLAIQLTEALFPTFLPE